MRKYFAFLFALVLFSAVGCSPPKESVSRKPLVFVSVSVYQPIVAELCRSVAKVQAIIPPLFDIHFFEAKPSDMKELTKGVIWFGVGEGFEKKLLAGMKDKSSIKYVNLSEYIQTLSTISNSCHHHGDHEESHGHIYKDLHIWMSPISMIEQIQVMQKFLIAEFPSKEAVIKSNGSLVIQKLLALNQKIETILAPYVGESLLMAHPSLGYYCHTYHLEQISIECEGKSPSPRDIEALLQKLQHTKIRCAFTQRGFPDTAAKKMAADLHFPVYEIDPYRIDYSQNLIQISEEIAQ